MEHEADLSGLTLIEETQQIPKKIKRWKKTTNGRQPNLVFGSYEIYKLPFLFFFLSVSK